MERADNLLFSFLALAANLVTLVALAAAIAALAVPSVRERLQETLREIPRALAFLIALTATLGSLYYSEIEGFVPCQLCIEQRYFMYPTAAILGFSLLVGRREWQWLAAPLVVVGACYSAYHVALEQAWVADTGICSAGPPCATPYFIELEIVSLAYMALAGFLAVGALLALDLVLHGPTSTPEPSPDVPASDAVSA